MKINYIKNKKNFIKIVIFIVLISFVFFISKQVFYNRNKHDILEYYISDIIEIFNSIQIVEQKFFDKLTFKLCEKQPVLGGGSIKFLLKGSDGNKWLFKCARLWQKETLASSKLAQLFGINTPEFFTASLIINNRKVRGSIQKFINSSCEISLRNNFFTRKAQENLIKLQIFHWLINKREDVSSHFLVDDKGKIYSIDLKLTLRYDRIFPGSFEEKLSNPRIKGVYNYNFFADFWGKYLELPEKHNLQVPFGFIKYIEQFNSNYLSDFLRRYGINEENIKKFIFLKENLSRDFKEFLSFITEESNTEVNIYYSNDFISCAEDILNDLRMKLNYMQHKLNYIPEKRQKSLKIITTLFYMHDFAKSDLKKMSYKQVLTKIQDKKKVVPNIYELLGLHLLESKILYRLKNGVDEKEMFPNEKLFVSLPCNELSLQEVEEDISFLPIEKKFFIIALCNAIKGNFFNALQLLQKSIYYEEEKDLLLSYIEKTQNILN